MVTRKRKTTTRRRKVAKKPEPKYIVSGKLEYDTAPVSQAEAMRTEKKIRSMGGTARRKKV